MTEDLHQRAKKLFLEACELPPEEREALLDRECADDPALRAEVESLLKHDAPTFAASPSPESRERATAPSTSAVPLAI